MSLLQPLQEAIGAFLAYIPQLIGAIIILVVGWLLARALQAVVDRLLRGVGFDRWMERGGVKQFFDRAQTDHTPASVIGVLVFWFVLIVAITMAADALGVPQVTAFLNQLLAYIPSVLAAVLILFLAALLANFLSGIVRGATGSGILASVVYYAVIIYAVFAALTQLGIAVEITAPTFLILLGAVALALAIAFGLGGREVAQEIIERAYNRRQEVTGGGGGAAPTAGGEQQFGGATGEGSVEGERPRAHRLRRDQQ